METAGEETAKASGRWLRWLLVALGVVALLVAAYASAGYWLAPRLIASGAKAYAHDKLHQELSLGEVKVDPFRFSADISDIAIPAAAPMVRVGRLHVDFAARSLFGDSYRLDSVRVTAPQVDAVIRPDGRLNLLDLMPPPSKDPLPPVLIADLDVEGGSARLADESKAGHPEAHLSPVTFHLQNLHTTRDEGGKFRLSGQSDAGETFAWKGSVSLAPVASRGGLALRGLKSATVQKFAGEMLPAQLAGGEVDADLAYAASWTDAGLQAWARLPKMQVRALTVDAGKMAHARVDVGGLALADTAVQARMPAGGALSQQLSVGGVALRDIRVSGTGPAAGEAIRLKAADVGGVNLDRPQSPVIATVRLSGLDTVVTRDGRGRISLLKMASGGGGGGEKGAAALPAIGEMRLEDARIRFVDKAVKPVTTWTVTPLSVRATGAGPAGGPLRLTLSGRVNGATSFAAEGQVDPRDASADLAVRMAGFPVKAAVPYTVDFPRLAIASGTASADGRLRYGPKLASWRGRAAVDHLALIETYGNSNLMKWKRLEMEGIDATPQRASIDKVRVIEPFGTVSIFPDGTMNFQRLVTFNPQPVMPPAPDVAAKDAPKPTKAERRAAEQKAVAEKQAAAATARAALAAPIVEPAIPVTVKEVEVRGGTMDFADYSLQPNFAARVEGVHGTISNVSNSPRAVTKVKLDGYVIDKYSPVTITGQLTPMQYDRRTDVDMAFRNIELPVFNPYSGRWAGYSIAKGKLTTELSYHIDNRALEAKHHIVIDQLEWGNATDSKEKVSLPIKFATSLMKDKNGVIELDVPVSGTLDDPSFRLGPIIWKVIGNVLEKAVTAPFRALGSLFGDKEDVQFVDFAPGSAVVPAAATGNLASIAHGLGEKPELRLDIPAGPGLRLDGDALADRKIAAAIMPKEVKKGGTPDLAQLDAGKRRDKLEDLYRSRTKAKPAFPAGPEGEDKEARRARETEWLLAELRKTMAPSAEELAALGKQRADAVRLALLQGATAVDPARLFVSARDSATEKDGKARMELKLEGS